MTTAAITTITDFASAVNIWNAHEIGGFGSVAEVEYTKLLTALEFRQVMRASNFIGAVAFWRALERLTQPEPQTRLDAMQILRDLARQAFEDCGRIAFSPQEAECFEYCGLKPLGLRSPGSAGHRAKD